MKTILLTCLFTLSSIVGFAQNKKRRDSLKHELAISRADTNRVLVLIQLINSYKFSIPDSAFFYGQQALVLARHIKFPKGEANALYFLSVTNGALGNSSSSLELILKSLQIADKNNLIGAKTSAFARLGNIYVSSKNYSKALFYFHQSLKLFDSFSDVLALDGLANVYLEMNKLDSAEYYSLLTTNFIKQYNIDWARPNNLRTIAEIYNKKGETQLALDILHQSLMYNLFRSRSSFEIAKIYQKTNHLDSAIYYAQNSLDDAQKSKSYSSIVTASSLLAELYEQKDAKKTIGYNKITIAALDSLNNFGKSNAFKNISDFDEKERQYEIETAKTDYKNQIRQYALLAGVGVFLLIAFILYRNNNKQKKANNLLYQQKEEIQTTLSQLKSTQTQLIQSEKMASLGELTAGIAHEIQNPLNFVNNFSEVNKELLAEMNEEIERGNYDEVKAIAKDVSDNQEKINHHGKRADAIVKGMLQHSRRSSGVKEPTDINALANEYLRLAYHGLRAKDKSFNATMKTDFDDRIGNIHIIPQDIGMVILNLLTNAFYAVTEKKKQLGAGFEPTVTITTKKLVPLSGRPQGVEVRVTDNGNGIPQKVLDKIFQPFFTTKPTGEGTGLGLSLSYDIVKAHGGELKVETKEGEGTVFVILLPT